MISRTGAILLTVVLAVPLALFGTFLLITYRTSGFPFLIGLVVLIGLGVWVAVVNLRFAFRVAGLTRRHAEDDALPDPAGISCEQALIELEDAPGDWRYWYRLGYAYHRAGYSSEARQAMEHALRLSARGGDGSRATSAGTGRVTRLVR